MPRQIRIAGKLRLPLRGGAERRLSGSPSILKSPCHEVFMFAARLTRQSLPDGRALVVSANIIDQCESTAEIRIPPGHGKPGDDLRQSRDAALFFSALFRNDRHTRLRHDFLGNFMDANCGGAASAGCFFRANHSTFPSPDRLRNNGTWTRRLFPKSFTTAWRVLVGFIRAK